MPGLNPSSTSAPTPHLRSASEAIEVIATHCELVLVLEHHPAGPVRAAPAGTSPVVP
jgi:hypothetical protein